MPYMPEWIYVVLSGAYSDMTIDMITLDPVQAIEYARDHVESKKKYCYTDPRVLSVPLGHILSCLGTAGSMCERDEIRLLFPSKGEFDEAWSAGA